MIVQRGFKPVYWSLRHPVYRLFNFQDLIIGRVISLESVRKTGRRRYVFDWTMALVISLVCKHSFCIATTEMSSQNDTLFVNGAAVEGPCLDCSMPPRKTMTALFHFSWLYWQISADNIDVLYLLLSSSPLNTRVSLEHCFLSARGTVKMNAHFLLRRVNEFLDYLYFLFWVTS